MAFVFKQQYDSFTEQQMRNFFLTLSEKDRRRYAALEAIKLGHGAIEYIASLFGCSRRTIEKAITEIRELEIDPVGDRIRRPGAGRKKLTDALPELAQNFFDR